MKLNIGLIVNLAALAVIPALTWGALMAYALTGWTVPVHEPFSFWFALWMLWIACIPLLHFWGNANE